MRHVREALRLLYTEGLSQRKTAAALSLGRATLQEYLVRFKASGLPLDQALLLSDEDLSGHLFGASPPSRLHTASLDLEYLTGELKRPGVTIQLLWEEYRKAHPEGLGRTQFGSRVREYRGVTNLVMRQDHKPGERVMVDYSGDRLSLVDSLTGEVRYQELFVMVWAASGLVYAEAQTSQKVVDWSMGHVHGFEYFGCSPWIVTPDCLKSAVTKAHRYDPILNRTYVDMCAHYGAVAVPARPHSPRDKGKVENAVRLMQQRIIAVLRDQIFHDLPSLNVAVRQEVDRINSLPMQGYDKKTRRELFEEIDRPAARALAAIPWEYQEWMRRKAGPDYCVEVEKHWYSVPHELSGTPVDVRLTATAVEIYHDRERVAVHVRARRRFGHTIQASHMPEAHRKVLEQDLAQLSWRAKHIGPNMQSLVQARNDSFPHPVQAVRPCLGLIRRAESFGNRAAVERAAAFALARQLLHCDDFDRILKSRAAEVQVEEELGVVIHGNLHGQALWTTEE